MYKIYPYVTKDLSVGLFSPSDDDIYHSATGAATEAYTKFIFPANIDNFLCSHDKIRVLDICYGIGYNTKSFINFIFQNKFKNFPKNLKNINKLLSIYNYKIHNNNNSILYNDKIYSDNAKELSFKINSYNNKIYTDKKSENFCNKVPHDTCNKNVFEKEISIYIKAIDTDKTLAFLSPFINSKISKIPKNQFKNIKIEKFRKNNDKNCNTYFNNSEMLLLTDYPPAINMLLLDSIVREYPEILSSAELDNIISDNILSDYFSLDIRRVFQFYKSKEYNLSFKSDFSTFLHNIYYKHISQRHKSDLKALKSLDIYFELKINDARLEIKSDASTYDFIFLDAFTPTKCPCLWTIDFFKLLYDHLSDDGMILTYSTSAAVRNAFINSGFYIGKIFNPIENKFSGTVATKNKSLIKYELSEFDLGLLKTKAGIFYRDENLTALNEAIIARRNLEVENSDLISTTQYMRNNK